MNLAEFLFKGNNLGTVFGIGILFSGTVLVADLEAMWSVLTSDSGAACEAALEGVQSAAFSGDSGAQISYTTLKSTPNAASTKAARVYAELTTKFVDTFLTTPGPKLVAGTTINVNYPAVTTTCSSADKFKFVLTRVAANLFATDVQHCGSTRLPTETPVINNGGCYASVSVINASSKTDAAAAAQSVVLTRVGSLLVCI